MEEEKRSRARSEGSSDDTEPMPKKSCLNGETVTKDLSSVMNSSAESCDIRLVYNDSVEEETAGKRLSEAIGDEEEICGTKKMKVQSPLMDSDSDKGKNASSDEDNAQTLSILSKSTMMNHGKVLKDTVDTKIQETENSSSDSDVPLKSLVSKKMKAENLNSKSLKPIATKMRKESAKEKVKILKSKHSKSHKVSPLHPDSSDEESEAESNKKEIRKKKSIAKKSAKSMDHDVGTNSKSQVKKNESSRPNKGQSETPSSSSDNDSSPKSIEKTNKEGDERTRRDCSNNADSTSDSDTHSDSDHPKNLQKTMTDSRKKRNGRDDEDSGPNSNSDSEASSKKDVIKNSKDKVQDPESTSDSGPDPDLDSEPEEKKDKENEKSGKDGDSKTVSQKAKARKSVDDEDPHKNVTIIRLKKYIHAAGMRIQYAKLWEGCRNNKDRAKKMKSFLKNAGIDGSLTMKSCKDFKEKKERDAELKELSENVIINENGRALRRRSRNVPSPTSRTVPSEVKKTFQRLQAVFDSDSD